MPKIFGTRTYFDNIGQLLRFHHKLCKNLDLWEEMHPGFKTVRTISLGETTHSIYVQAYETDADTK